jgi:hypothetical protein
MSANIIGLRRRLEDDSAADVKKRKHQGSGRNECYSD